MVTHDGPLHPVFFPDLFAHLRRFLFHHPISNPVSPSSIPSTKSFETNRSSRAVRKAFVRESAVNSTRKPTYSDINTPHHHTNN